MQLKDLTSTAPTHHSRNYHTEHLKWSDIPQYTQ
jgi:hypothetical protein